MSKPKRQDVSKSTRFEVFKRDRFTCRYCGAKAPDVVLVIEHVLPVVEGGTNELLNLVAACETCNQGKGPRLLDDASRVHAERAELDRIAEAREQLRMMAEWRNDLRDARMTTLAGYFEANAHCTLTEVGRTKFRRFLTGTRNPPTDQEVLDAIDRAVSVYVDPEKMLNALPGIVHTDRQAATRPHLRELYYIRGILRRRNLRVDERFVIAMMETAIERGMSTDEIQEHAKNARNWTEFRRRIGDTPTFSQRRGAR